MSRHLVIANKNNNLEWTAALGFTSADTTIVDVTEAPGGGSAAYVRYIVDNYNSLPDYLWLMRGLTQEGWCQGGFWPMERLNTELTLDFDLLVPNQFDFSPAEVSYCELMAKTWNDASASSHASQIISHIGGSDHSTGPWNWFNQFIVSKSLILTKPKAYYQTLLDLLVANTGGDTDNLMSVCFHEAFFKGLTYTSEFVIGVIRHDIGHVFYRRS